MGGHRKVFQEEETYGKNVGMFGMQEEFFLGLSSRLDHDKMSLFRIFSASKRNLFSIWQARGSLL